MGQTQTHEGIFFCRVYKLNYNETENVLIDDPSEHFFRIDDSSWEKINMLMENHLLKTFQNLRLNGLECGFGGDEGDGFVRYKSHNNITDIPPMFFSVTTADTIVYNLYKLDNVEIGPQKYRMDFIKKQDD